MCLLIMFLFHQHGWKLSRGLLESIQWHHPYKCWNVYNEAYENKVINMLFECGMTHTGVIWHVQTLTASILAPEAEFRHITIAELPE